MKRILTWSAALAMTTSLAFAAQQDANKDKNKNNNNAKPQQQQQQQQQAAQPAAPATPPGAKKLPEAKTQEEFDAYRQAATISDPAQLEKAANDFAQKFPQSEIRPMLFNQAMILYHQANNAEKAIEMGRKILAITPRDPVANLVVALDLAETTRDTDLDKDEKLNEAAKAANTALQSVDTELMVAPGTPPEAVDGKKQFVRAGAYSALGQVAMVKSDYPAAEQAYKKNLEFAGTDSAASTYLRLSIALDRQKKYQEALAFANKAVEASPAGSPMQQLATQERNRVAQLMGASQAKPNTPPPTTPEATATTPK